MPTIGMLHQVEARAGVVVGRAVAVSQLAQSLGTLSAHHDYRLYVPERQQGAIAESGGRLTVTSRRALRDDPSPAAWHDNGFDTFLPFAIRAKRGWSLPISITHHTLSYTALLHDSILRLLLSDTAPYDTLVCTTEPAKQALAALIDHVAEGMKAAQGVELGFRGQLDCIPLGVDAERFRPLEDKAAARERFDLPADAFVMLWLGRLSAVDKADMIPIVGMMADLVKARPDAKPVLLCAGTQRAGEQHGDVIASFAQELGLGDAVKVITDRDAFMPWLPELYGCADVFLSPIDNIQETFGLTPVEAMACGLPAVVSDWDGYRDTVVDGETGFLVPTRWTNAASAEISDGWLFEEPAYDHLALAQSVAVDQPAMLAALIRLIDAPELLAKLGAQARARVEEHYAWTAVVPRYEAMWQARCSEAAAAPRIAQDSARYAGPDYARAFGHFASHPLAGDQALKLSAGGRALLSGERPLPSHHNHTWGFLDLPLLQRIMIGFARMAESGETLSPERVVQVMGKGSDDPLVVGRLHRHLLWLLKYDLIALA